MMSLSVWSHVLSRRFLSRGSPYLPPPGGLSPDRGEGGLSASPREQNDETLLKTLPSLAVDNYLGGKLNC